MGGKDLQQWYVIVNPTAGAGRGLSEFPQISRQLRDAGVEYEPVFTEHKFHAVEYTVSAIKAGYRKLLVVGGDGTMLEVVTGLFIQQCCAPSDILLGVIAVGDINNCARSAGIPLRIDNAIKVICDGHSFLQDVGVVSYEEAQYRQSRYIVNAAGVGFSTYVLKKIKHQHNKGHHKRWKLIWTYIKAFFRYRPTGVKLWIDDELVYSNLLMGIAIGIGRYSANGMQQLPKAIVDDGMLDLSLIRPVHFWHILFRIRYFFDGGIYRIGHIMQGRGSKIRIESTPQVSLEIDGEVMGESPFEFEVLPKAIRLIAPADRRI